MLLRTVHISCAVLTIGSFVLRGILMLRAPALLQNRLSRVLPHVIDTVLFFSGLFLAVMLYGAFYQQRWLLGKLLAVIVYIVLGAIALHLGSTRKIRGLAFVAALGVFAYIVLTAHTKSLLPI
ncbi:MAG: SirB2 family protein [Gammaproteobacteria bacterium]|nr:SirB2 family protein [Gammaproteobacteria bacterium]